MSKKNPIKLTKDDMKQLMPAVYDVLLSDYAKASKAVLSAKTRLRNALARQQQINRAMFEIGYEVGSE